MQVNNLSDYPIDIENFHNSILKIKGIQSIVSGIDNLDGIDCKTLSLSDYAHLPHATLMRTKGGLKDEALIQFEFTIDNSLNGLGALEFLAWFVRDQARSGVKIQLRPFALPPVTPYGRQIGETLKFHIDIFEDGIGDSLDKFFMILKRVTETLEKAIDLYGIPMNDNV